MADEPTPHDAAPDDEPAPDVGGAPAGAPAAGGGTVSGGDPNPGDDADPADDAVRADDAVPAGDPTPGDEPSGHDADAATGSAAVDDADVVDELPEDLDAAGFVGPYLFPNNNRRRVPGYLYLVSAVACAVLWLAVDDSPYVNSGFLLAAALLAVVGAYQLISGWNLDVDEQDALVAATRAVGFPVGHASAQMGWRGLLSRPTWRILLYSADTPPAKRGLVLVDGVDGEVIQHFVEDNPEDWSDLDDGAA